MRRTLALLSLVWLACPSVPSPASPPPRAAASRVPMKTLTLADVKMVEVSADDRTRAYQPSPSLRFVVDGPPEVKGSLVRLRGALENDDAVAHEVMFFPAGPAGLYLGVVPNRGVTPRPPPPGAPSMPPPVPPPPQSFSLPAHTRLALETTLDASGYVFPPGATIELEWRYGLWNANPPPSGTLRVAIP